PLMPSPQATNPDGTPAFVPIIVQSNPQIVYVVNNGKLQRSSDGGKTYSGVALPTTDLTQVSITVTVSPLDTQRIYVTLYGLRNGQGCLPTGADAAPASNIQPHSASSAQQGALVKLSGYGPCSEQYTSASGGGSWSKVHLPVAGVLAATTTMRTILGFVSAPPYTFQAQGSALFAMAGYSGQDGALGGGQPGIVRSDDGGATWRQVNQPPINASSGQSVCDFAAAPSGQTLYAIVDQGCGNAGAPTISLWRSKDGGANWSQIHTFTNVVESGMSVAADGTLYIDLPRAQFTSGAFSAGASSTNTGAGGIPYSALSGGGTINATPNAMLASANEGASFAAAPVRGVSSNTSIFGPFAILADGSVVALGTPNGSQSNPDTLYTWKLGASSWQKVNSSEAGDGFVYAQTSTVGGQETLYVVTASGKIVTFAI
ncbi:MAG: sialidase family protein, partial [Ktedonobacterales bacterium]